MIELKIPMLGICFGHQLIAKIMGATVAFDSNQSEIGWVNVRELSTDTEHQVFVWHNSSVIFKPVDSEVLASSERCKIEKLSYLTSPIISVQFHPERGVSLGRAIMIERSQELEQLGINPKVEIEKAQTADEEYRLGIFAEFLDLVHTNQYTSIREK